LTGLMNKNLDIITYAVSLIVKATLFAARFSGRVRKRSLKRLAATDADTEAKEILFLKDKVYQLKMQVSILQKQLNKRGKSPRYTVHERLLILWHMEAFQIPRRQVVEYFGIACACQAPMGPPRTPAYPLEKRTVTSPKHRTGILTRSEAIVPLESPFVTL